MTAKVREGLGQMGFVEVDLYLVERERANVSGLILIDSDNIGFRDNNLDAHINEYQPIEILGRFSQQAAVRAVDPGVAVVAVWCFDFDVRRCVLGDTLLREALEGREHVGAGFDGVGWADDVGIGVADVGVGVWIVESGLVGVDGPCCDVDLGELLR